MMSRKNLFYIKLFLIGFSLLFAFLIFELFLLVLKAPTFSQYEQRFRIDGEPSPNIGYYKVYDRLPHKLKSHWKHSIEDAWSPIPYHVSLDEFGYRNPANQKNQFDRVFVGDSVTFGVGVSDEATMANRYRKLTKKQIYNLSIPGVGPATYMYMIKKFLARAKTKSITVIFYLNNDIDNLKNSYWNNMFKMQPPALDDHVVRQDQSHIKNNPPLWLTNNALTRNLRSTRLLFNAYIEYLWWKTELRSLYIPESTKTIESDKKTDRDFFKDNLALIDEFKNSKRLDQHPEIKKSLIALEEFAKQQSLKNYEREFREFSKKIFKARIFPFDKNNKSITAKFYNSNHNHLARFNTTPTQRTNYRLKKNIASNQKFQIFIEFLQGIKKDRDIDVDVFICGAEYSLDDNTIKYSDNIKKQFLKAGIKTFNLIPLLKRYYTNQNNDSLFYDHSHWNENGNEMVAQLLVKIHRGNTNSIKFHH